MGVHFIIIIKSHISLCTFITFIIKIKGEAASVGCYFKVCGKGELYRNRSWGLFFFFNLLFGLN